MLCFLTNAITLSDRLTNDLRCESCEVLVQQSQRVIILNFFEIFIRRYVKSSYDNYPQRDLFVTCIDVRNHFYEKQQDKKSKEKSSLRNVVGLGSLAALIASLFGIGHV